MTASPIKPPPSDSITLTVFGANGPTGRLVVQSALEAGHRVVAFTRRPDSFPIEHPRLAVAAGDVHNRSAVATALEGADAVISTLGVPFGKQPVDVYSDGIASIIAGMHGAGIKRLVAVSSSALVPHTEPLGGWFFEKVMQPYLTNKLGKTVYDDMRRMEAALRASDVAWTIVRPSGLFMADGVSDYLVAEDTAPHRYTARNDLAACLVAEATSDLHVRAAIAVVTPSASPSMLKLIWNEGIRKKP